MPGARKNLDAYYRELTPKEAPKLFAAVNEIAHKSGVPAPTLHLLRTDLKLTTPNEKFRNILHEWTIGITEKGHMIMGTKAMNTFGFHKIKAPVSEEFTAIIAHELAHLKHKDFTARKWIRRSPWIGAGVAMAALAMFEHYHTQKKEERKPEDRLPGEEGYSHAQEARDNEHPILGGMLTTAKYLAAAALGLGTGLFVMKTMHHRMEFRADAFSAELMGSGKPMIRAFKMFSDATRNEGSRMANVLREAGVSERAIAGIIKINNFQAKITHPPIAKRIERLGGL